MATLQNLVCGKWQRYVAVGVMAAAMAVMTSESLQAQGRGGGGRRGGFGGVTSYVQLASLPEVQKALGLSEAQTAKAKEIADALSEERRSMFQGGGGGGGDFAERMEKMNKLNNDAAEKLMAAIEEKQRERLSQVFVQVNGAAALTDSHIAKHLGVSEEQGKKLAEVVTASREEMRSAFQNQQDASAEERTAARAKLSEARDEKLLAVLSGEQKEKFAGMKGEKLEIDLSQLQGQGGRGGRGGRGGN